MLLSKSAQFFAMPPHYYEVVIDRLLLSCEKLRVTSNGILQLISAVVNFDTQQY